MKSTHIILYICIIGIIAIALSFALTKIIFLEAHDIPMDVNVGSGIGFNTDTDAIHFGTIPRGNMGSRNITIENSEHASARILIKTYGEISGWVDVSENNFVLKKGEKRDVKFTIILPEGIEKKKYSGTARIMLMRF